MADAALFVMAYGTPAGLDDVERYYTRILGRTPPRALLDELTRRYAAIGGRSPLNEITAAQAAALAERTGAPAFVGQKFTPPFIADAVDGIVRGGFERALGIVLAPHYSELSVGDYERRARAAAAGAGWEGRIEVVPSWHLEPGYVRLLAAYVAEALERLTPARRAAAEVLFTAHSLPASILESGDPYPRQLEETAAAVAARAGLERWGVAWQSAGRTDEPWLGPDILQRIGELAAASAGAVVVCPCGFVADHLEVLYDVDVEAARAATSVGIELVRTRMPNTDPAFVDALAAVVSRALAG